jgi:hypothetical protein
MKHITSTLIWGISLLTTAYGHAQSAALPNWPLWTGGAVPKSDELRFPAGIERRPITPSEPGKTLPPGWRKGVDVAWHKGVLYAAFGSNEKFKEQGENSPGEAAVYLTSRDAGRTWSEVRDIARGEGQTGISHGVFLSHQDQLWFFCGAFEAKLGKARTLAYLLDEASGSWTAKGQIIGDGFWPLQKPMQLPGGNWIMSGLRAGNGSPAAVAISRGNDWTAWELVVIPQAKTLGKMWGESALLRDGGRLINIARYGAEAVALVAESTDEGRSWSPSMPSNLPMTTSKPYAGTLHSGQPYLVCTTTADARTKRHPLTIAVGKPGGSGFVRIFALDDEGSLMYPGCDEHEGSLYIGYTRGFEPQLAVVPVASLAIDAAGTLRAEPKIPTPREWPLESPQAAEIVVHGQAQKVVGAERGGLSLDGSSLIELADSAHLNPGMEGFTISVWFNPYALEGSQQMIVGKNRYSRNERQWGLTIEPNGRLKAHLRQDGWSEIACDEPIIVGGWHLANLTVATGKATLFLNGKQVGEVTLKRPLAATPAPITLGGIWDTDSVRQPFHGALDEFSFQPRVLTATEIAARYHPVSAKLPVLETEKRVSLWDETRPVPKAAEIPLMQGVRFSVIKPYEFLKDGYRFLHGVGLGFHQGKLYASFGHNRGGENTDSEEARFCISTDRGRSWSAPRTMDDGGPECAVSHGVFHAHQGRLWAFMGSYRGTMQGIHTRAYRLNEATGEFDKLGVVIEGGFWPMQQPIRMDDGNWIMSGISVGGDAPGGGNHPAAVAISHGEDFLAWDIIRIPQLPNLGKVWGESTVMVQGKSVTNISRYGSKACALTATSEDYGRTWTAMGPSNLPMATSKPFSGILSTGQRFLVCTTTADTGGRRSPLTIAFSKPGQSVFSTVRILRHAWFPEGPGESHERASLAYPYAIEHEGFLFIGYSNNGGNIGRVGQGRELWNNNSAELAIIPIDKLEAE